MNTTQRGIVTLLKSAVTEEKLPLPEDFSLEQAEEIARKQSLLPLIYQGAYNCGISADSAWMERYRMDYYRILMHSKQQMRFVERIFKRFEEADIDYMPLKGVLLKNLYPQPEMRMMGDADILIRTGQYELIRPIMLELGFAEGRVSQHECCWERKELHLELHKGLFANLEKEFYACFGDGWSWARKQEGCRYRLKPEDEYVYLLTHAAKHYRSSGIGCRHFLDLYVFRQQHPQMKEPYIEQLAERVHLLQFYRNTLRLLDVWFGDSEPNAVTEAMTEYIFSGGNWGNTQNKDLSLLVRHAAGAEEVKHSKLRIFRQALFPPMADMQYRYLILLKYPWLYPAIWVYRAFQLLFGKTGAIGKKLRQIQTTGDQEISTHREMLKAVGLDFYEE